MGFKANFFSLANTHTHTHTRAWLSIITFRVRSHDQFPSKLVERCYAETITHVILHVPLHVHPDGTTLAGGTSINLFTFLKPDPVTISRNI